MTKRKNTKVAVQPPGGHNPQVDRPADRILRLETTVDNLTANFATKDDLSRVYGKLDAKIESVLSETRRSTVVQLRWIILLFIALAGLFYNMQDRHETRLNRQMDQRFEQVERRFEQMDQRFEQVERRFEQMERRFDQMDRRFEALDRRFERIEQALFVPAKRPEPAVD